jgi:hypothetical protein
VIVAKADVTQTDVTRTRSDRSDFPQLELGHLSKFRTDGDTRIYEYDLQRLSVPRPRRGSTRTTVVCSRCEQEFGYVVHSRTALFRKRLIPTSAALIPALAAAALGALTWHFGVELSREPQNATPLLLVLVIGFVALIPAFTAGVVVFEGLTQRCAELRGAHQGHVLRQPGKSVVIEAPSPQYEINADVGGGGHC